MIRIQATVLVAASILAAALPAAADDARDFNVQVDAALAGIDWPGMVRMPIGVTPRGTLIWCLMDEDALDYRTPNVRALLVAALDGSPGCVDACLQRLRDGTRSLELTPGHCVALIPIANPDAWGMRSSITEDDSTFQPLVFPPEGHAYAGHGVNLGGLFRSGELRHNYIGCHFDISLFFRSRK